MSVHYVPAALSPRSSTTLNWLLNQESSESHGDYVCMYVWSVGGGCVLACARVYVACECGVCVCCMCVHAYACVYMHASTYICGWSCGLPYYCSIDEVNYGILSCKHLYACKHAGQCLVLCCRLYNYCLINKVIYRIPSCNSLSSPPPLSLSPFILSPHSLSSSPFLPLSPSLSSCRRSKEETMRELSKAVNCIVDEFLKPDHWGLIPRPT